MRILIIKFGALGDIIMSTPIIKQLQEHYSGHKIYLLTSPTYKKLFLDWKNLNVKTINRGGLVNVLRAIMWIRKQNFSILFDLQSNDRTSVISAFSNISLRAGNHPRFPYHINPSTTYKGQCHSFDRLNEILQKAGIPSAPAKPYLPTNEHAKKVVDAWLIKKELLSRKFVVIHAGSSLNHKQKRWTRFLELAKKLYESKIDVVWVGGDDDKKINKKLSLDYGINATCKFSIPELIELGRKAIFAVTNDSAPMHILSCSDIPIYGLFGPTNPIRTHALGQKKRVVNKSGSFPLNDADFSPCNISEITLLQVIEKIKEDGFII